jgi:hypothetical protein
MKINFSGTIEIPRHISNEEGVMQQWIITSIEKALKECMTNEEIFEELGLTWERDEYYGLNEF